MRRRPLAIVALFILGLGVAFTLGQTKAPTDGLYKWSGKYCRIYLKVESDPRIGRTTFTGSGTADEGVLAWEGIPISVSGKVATTDGGYVVLSYKNGATAWIPHSEIRLMEMAADPGK
jgi:hypothetical protein